MSRRVKTTDVVLPGMETIELREETVERLDGLRIEDESYDELVTELINIYEAEELTLFHSGDG
jgi:predicted CopG family antitoxin